MISNDLGQLYKGRSYMTRQEFHSAMGEFTNIERQANKEGYDALGKLAGLYAGLSQVGQLAVANGIPGDLPDSGMDNPATSMKNLWELAIQYQIKDRCPEGYKMFEQDCLDIEEIFEISS